MHNDVVSNTDEGDGNPNNDGEGETCLCVGVVAEYSSAAKVFLVQSPVEDNPSEAGDDR